MEKGGEWFLESSPGEVRVRKGAAPLKITCVKTDYMPATVEIEDYFDPIGMTNLLYELGTFSSVDVFTGAAEIYPSRAAVWMEPIFWKSKEYREHWRERKRAYGRMLKEAHNRVRLETRPKKQKN